MLEYLPEIPIKNIVEIKQLNLSSLERFSYTFYRHYQLKGTIPNLPPKLINGNSAFKGCSGLTGNIPKLPQSLEYAFNMFSGCSGLTGKTPPMPPELTDYDNTFEGTQVTNDGSWPSDAW